MARSLEQLQKQYNTSSKGPGKGPGGPGGPGMGHGPRGGRGPGGPGGRGPGGKPKNAKVTIARLLAYLKPHYGKMALVLCCMLTSTITSLIGSFMLMPIINHLAGVATTAKDGAMAVLADKFITSCTSGTIQLLGQTKLAEVLVYLLTALLILLCVYLVGICANYLQARLMLHITQTTLEKIRNDLFSKLQKLPVRYYDSHPTGEIMSRFTNDVDNIDSMLNHSLTSLISGSVSLIGTFVFMITTNWSS